MENIITNIDSISLYVSNNIHSYDPKRLMIVPNALNFESNIKNYNLKNVNITNSELDRFFKSFPRHAAWSIFLSRQIVEIKISMEQAQNLKSAMDKRDKNHLLLLVNHYYKLQNPSNVDLSSPYISQIHALIDEYYSKELTVGFYARKLSLSPSNINKIILAEDGKQINQLINEKLMSDAIKDLIDSRLKIRDISNKLSFNSPAHFSTWFKRLKSCSPLEYRQKYKL